MSTENVAVEVKQNGGKYGVFECPNCGNNADYKFTASSGFCSCGAIFCLTSETNYFDGRLDDSKYDYVIDLEMTIED